jgi:hypothetical protein
MCWKTMCAVSLCAMIVLPMLAQTPDLSNTRSTTCTFSDGKQMRVNYTPVPANNKEEASNDKLWSPGGRPMYLFTQGEVSIGGKEIPAGAYSMYFIPGGDKWTLVVNSEVSPGSQYDEKRDLLRVPMQIAQLGSSQAFTLGFGHLAPKQCNIRIYFGKIGAWAPFKEH